LESEAALALTMRMGCALDHAQNPHEKSFVRLATAVGKYWICKRAPELIYEASECMGGAGYIEETILPRLYREAPVNSIWEGSGNVQCLDLLRALAKDPGMLDVLFAELDEGRGDVRLKRHIENLKVAFLDHADIQYRARQLCEDTAVALQATLLLEAGHCAILPASTPCRLGGGLRGRRHPPRRPRPGRTRRRRGSDTRGPAPRRCAPPWRRASTAGPTDAPTG